MTDQAVLIVAASGRALAASARRGGFAPLVADWFGDQDTLAAAAAHRHLARGLAYGMEADAVLAALEDLARNRTPIGVVCGTGFEDRPELLARIAARWPLIGNSAATVARTKDPVALAALCRECGLPHPEISSQRPHDPDGWLVKRRGGAGGSHIKTELPDTVAPDRYVQRRVAGLAVSALVLADGDAASILGFSEQWCAPAVRQPFRYGGAVMPAHLAPRVRSVLEDMIRHLVSAAALRGLNSIDFLIDGDVVWVLEINPRPGATLDLFEPELGSLFASHIAACRGTLVYPPPPAGARAAAIVYPDAAIAAVPHLAWPDWTADRPQAGMAITPEAPVCTVLAAAASADEAKRLVVRRMRAVLSLLQQRAA
jgi:uncharacterized protein